MTASRNSCDQRGGCSTTSFRLRITERSTSSGGPGHEKDRAATRLPDELLLELAASADELRLEVGLMVTAAITHLLDQPDAVIGELVHRADDARIQGRRATRRTRGPRHIDEQAQVAVGPSTR